MFSPPVTRAQSLAADVEQIVRDQRLKPGDRIATMEELRERTKLGRATISEAARLLAERGGVEVRPGRGGGLFVAQANPLVRLRHTLLAAGDGAIDVQHAIAVRDALEGLIAADAARLADAGDIMELGEILRDMDDAVGDLQEFLAVNWQLHRRIAAITDNDLARNIYLATMERLVGLDSRPDAATSRDEVHYLQERADVHRELVVAIATNDVARVAAAVERHRDPAAVELRNQNVQ